MIITSPVFDDGQKIPLRYSCDGQGMHPPLTIADISDDTKSLVIIVEDPDAPMGTFDHWLLWNIPPTTQEIPENEIPQGAVEGVNSTGEVGWIPPCPPRGVHHYRFHLFALSNDLSLSEGANREMLEQEMEEFLLARAELNGLYERPT